MDLWWTGICNNMFVSQCFDYFIQLKMENVCKIVPLHTNECNRVVHFPLDLHLIFSKSKPLGLKNPFPHWKVHTESKRLESVQCVSILKSTLAGGSGRSHVISENKIKCFWFNIYIRTIKEVCTGLVYNDE